LLILFLFTQFYIFFLITIYKHFPELQGEAWFENCAIQITHTNRCTSHQSTSTWSSKF